VWRGKYLNQKWGLVISSNNIKRKRISQEKWLLAPTIAPGFPHEAEKILVAQGLADKIKVALLIYRWCCEVFPR
jgi:hypothetical protein